MNTPKQLGFRMPGEFEPHEATWIAWPHNRNDWPGRFHPIPWVYAEIVRKLSQVEKVRILMNDPETEQTASRILKKSHAEMGAVEFFHFPTNRVWTRDYGPFFVKNSGGEMALTNWQFNAWAKYQDFQLDNSIPAQIGDALGLRVWSPDLVMEGGSIDPNGAGLLLSTEECLLSPIQARNPHLSRQEVEQHLCDYLGLETILWLRNGIAGDDTHGHIDDLARFINRNTMVLVQESERGDPNFEALNENYEIARHFPLRLVTLPMPAPLFFNGVRLPASYANFYIANQMVLVPVFNDPNDRIALDTLADLFPDRSVIGINCVELVWGLGTLHCMTQQQPA